MSPAEKLEKMLAYFGTTKNKLGVEIGKRQTLYDINKGKIKSFSPDLVLEILKVYPNINDEWLLYDRGEMLKPAPSLTPKPYVSAEQTTIVKEPLKTNVSAIPYDDYMEVEFVDLSVQAGPLGGHALDELPKSKKMLVPREYDSGEYLVLRVDGNSMYKKDSDISIPAGTEILVKKYYLENGAQLPIRNNLFVIDAKDGQALKQIILHDVEKGFIRCHSYNDDYKDYDVKMEDVLQIFIYRKVVSLRPPIPDINL